MYAMVSRRDTAFGIALVLEPWSFGKATRVAIRRLYGGTAILALYRYIR